MKSTSLCSFLQPPCLFIPLRSRYSFFSSQTLFTYSLMQRPVFSQIETNALSSGIAQLSCSSRDLIPALSTVPRYFSTAGNTEIGWIIFSRICGRDYDGEILGHARCDGRFSEQSVDNKPLKRSDDRRQCRSTQEKQRPAAELHLFVKVDTFNRHLMSWGYGSQRNTIAGYTMELTYSNLDHNKHAFILYIHFMCILRLHVIGTSQSNHGIHT